MSDHKLPLCTLLQSFFWNPSILLRRLVLIVFLTSGISLAAISQTGGITISATVTDISYEYYGYYSTGLQSFDYGIYYNGTVNITVTGGTGPYTYRVTPGLSIGVQSTGYFTGLGPGPRTYEVIDATGMVVKDTTITLPFTYPQPSVTLSAVSPPTSCTSTDGSFTLIGSGGTPPYTYSIDGGNTFTTSNVFTGLSSGAYSFLLVRDANGQLAFTGFPYNSVNDNNFSGPCGFSILSNLVAASCSGSTGSLTVANEGGTPPIQYSSDGTNYFPGTKTYYTPTIYTLDSQYYYTFTNLPAGTLHVYAKDSLGVISELTVPVLKSCPFNITYVSVQAACQQNNGTITVTPVNGTPPYSYSINGSSAFQANNVFTGLASGEYSLMVRDANNLVAAAYGVVINNCPDLTLTETDEACGMKNGTITATGYKGTPPYQFSIDGVTFQTSNVFTGLASGPYTVTIKDAGGFTSTAYAGVSNNCLQLTLAETGSTCGYKNGAITATGSNGMAPYQYSKDNITFQSGNLFDSLAAGSYTITLRDNVGLTTTSTILVTGAPGPQISIAAIPASCVNTNGSITITATGGTAPLQFSINNGAITQTGNTFGSLDSGQYIAWVSDDNSCIVTDTVHLSAFPTPSVSLGNDTILCAGDSLLLVAADSTTYQYQWQDGTQGYSYTVKTQGIYSVKVTNRYGCSVSSTISIDYRPLPAVSLGNDTALCNGQALSLMPVLPAQGSYLWSNGTTGPALSVTSPGLYWIQLTDYGCRNRDSIQIAYKPAPVVNMGSDTTLCTGQTLLLDATNNNATYLWQDGSALPSFTVSNAGTYSVVVDESGCDTTAKIVVAYITKPIVNLGSDTLLCTSERLSLDASYPQSTYLWQDGSTQPLYTVSLAGTYTVDITNICGDTKDSVAVSYQNCACQFHVPSAFSPNGDGVNDLFLPKNYCAFSDFDIKVFDRWGKMIFHSTNASLGWNGDSGNRPQPSGTYVYELVYKDGVTGNTVLNKGTLVLIR